MDTHAVSYKITIFYPLKKWGFTVYNKYEEGKNEQRIIRTDNYLEKPGESAVYSILCSEV